jgi:hypothetical protein
LEPDQIYDEQLKLKKNGRWLKWELVFIRKTFFSNKVLLSFDDDVIF